MKKSIFKKALFMLLVISVMFNVDAQQVRTINNLPFQIIESIIRIPFLPKPILNLEQ